MSLELSLYINAGMVVSSALMLLSEEYGKKDSPAGKLLAYLGAGSKARNVPFEQLMFDEARKIKSKELMRIAILLLENRSRGSEIAEKLDGERKRIRSSKLSSARAAAKKAETKLCFPLMLLLIALIALCIAPALMNI